MNTGRGALIVGSNQSAIQTALDLADSGIPVTLVEESPFLGAPSIPQMLKLVKHPNFTLLTGAEVSAVRGDPEDLRVDVLRRPRYVDLEKCTGCGDCIAVCPMPLSAEGADCRAIHKPHPQAVPNVTAIEKAGTAPCRQACPIDQRAQGYIALVRERRFAEAYVTIKQENPFPSICGRVCNHRCEGSCNRGRVDAPVNVMGIKRFVADWAAEHPQEIACVMPAVKAEPKGKRVAIVGGGPAGLTCALDLVRQGYQVSVFEAQPVAGGMMRLGIPEHRLPPEVVQREIDEIAAAGVEIKLNHRVEDMGALLVSGFDAVFIAVGAHIGVELPIHGRKLPDVHLATDFLRAANLGRPVDVRGKRVLVIGGGNVGLDVAQVSVRCGAAWVGMSCLESRDKMPAFEWEIRDAEEEGVHVLPSRTFKEILGTSYVDGEWVTGVCCGQVDFRGFVNGRPDMDELPGQDEIILTDVVVFAVGQWPDLTGIPDELERYRGRWLVADARTQVTNIAGVTAGGDVVTGTRFIVDAIAAGHKAAHALDTYLRTGVPAGWQATNPSQPIVEFSPDEASARLGGPSARYAAALPRHELPKLPPEQRLQSSAEMYGGLTEEEAVAEARRCLVCGACSECLACARICAAGAIDHFQAPEQTTLDVGAALWAGGPPPGGVVHQLLASRMATAGSHLYSLPDDEFLASAVAAEAMADLAYFRRKGPVSRTSPMAASQVDRIGVFVCRCGGRIGQVLDVDRLVTAARYLPGVSHSQPLDFACQPQAAVIIRNQYEGRGLDRLVLAACSCCALDQVCDSCTYQRVRCKSNLLGVPFDLWRLPAEFVNIREQCAWVHSEQAKQATAKAGRLIAAAVARAVLMAPTARPAVEIDARVLVSGTGEAAPVCANALRTQSIAVAQCDELPIALSGWLGQFTVALRGNDWSWDVDASAVVLAPAAGSPVIEVLTRPGVFFCDPGGEAETTGRAVAAKVAALLAVGWILADHNAARVDPSRCLGCGTCARLCEYGAVQVMETQDERAPTPTRELLQLIGRAQPGGPRLMARVNLALCQGCGTCAAHCPSGAITAGYSTDRQIEAMLGAMLVN